MQSITKKLQILVLAMGVLLFANAASASLLSLTGTWFQNRGALIDIPAKGGAVFCAAYGGTKSGLEDGCVSNLAPALGGLEGSGAAVIDGSLPAAFTVPNSWVSVFPGTSWNVAVAVAPSVQQLQSTFTFMGPGPVGAPGNPNPARFEENHYLNSSARLGADFQWCPGGGGAASGSGPGVQNCTDANNATPTVAGNWNGVLGYTGGANKFGGTMSMIMGGIGYVTRIQLGVVGYPNAIGHQLVGGGGAKKGQVQGQTYAYHNFNSFPQGPVYDGFSTNFPCVNPLPALPAGCGLVVTQGPLIPSSIAKMDADKQVNFGMPWTTGTVTASNNDVPPTRLTAMGYDTRSAMGAGRITLVSGGTTHRYVLAGGNPQNYAALDIVNFTFGATSVPAMSPMGLITASVLIMLAVGYAFRRRLVTNE